MKEYIEMVQYVLENGQYKENRTGVSTISCFGYHYTIDISTRFPLLTTKEMYFGSMLHELLWYLTGEEHIRNLREKTKIWDAWADEDGLLESAYGRFWRRYPMPTGQLPGEAWAQKWVTFDAASDAYVFDQIQYVLDSINEIRSNKISPNLRRLVVTAWHPGNASVSMLPPCHYTFCFNVEGEYLNCHLTQRSGDVALGIPFNIASYALLTMVMAAMSGLKPGKFSHTIVDLHIYENHILGLKEQMKREPKELPTLTIANKSLNELAFDDFTLVNYQPHPRIKFDVAV